MRSIVCEIRPINPSSQHWGQVEVEVKGGKKGISSIYFTYRVKTHAHTHEHHILPNVLSKRLIGAHPCGGALAEPEI